MVQKRLFGVCAMTITLLLTPTPPYHSIHAQENAIPFPKEVPKDFQKNSDVIDCTRTTPTAIHRRSYSNDNEHWTVMIQGRDGRDRYISVYRTNRDIEQSSFMIFQKNDTGWEKIVDSKKDTVSAILEKLDKIDADINYTPEENEFFRKCVLGH